MTDTPQIELSPVTVCCPAHGEHLRAQWPSGFLIVSVTLAKAALVSEPLAEAVGALPGGCVDGKPHVERINEVLARRPLCYFVTRDVIRGAFMEAGIMRVGLCLLCGRSGLGGPYSVNSIAGVQDIKHACLECALDTGERMHRAKPNGGVWTA